MMVICHAWTCLLALFLAISGSADNGNFSENGNEYKIPLEWVFNISPDKKTSTEIHLPSLHKSSSESDTVSSQQNIDSESEFDIPTDQKISTESDLDTSTDEKSSAEAEFEIPPDPKISTETEYEIPSEQKISTEDISSEPKVSITDQIRPEMNLHLPSPTEFKILSGKGFEISPKHSGSGFEILPKRLGFENPRKLKSPTNEITSHSEVKSKVLSRTESDFRIPFEHASQIHAVELPSTTTPSSITAFDMDRESKKLLNYGIGKMATGDGCLLIRNYLRNSRIRFYGEGDSDHPEVCHNIQIYGYRCLNATARAQMNECKYLRIVIFVSILGNFFCPENEAEISDYYPYWCEDVLINCMGVDKPTFILMMISPRPLIDDAKDFNACAKNVLNPRQFKK